MLARPLASDTVMARDTLQVEVLRGRVRCACAAGGRKGVRLEDARADATIVGAHGAYLKGWRNASPAFSPTTGNTIRLEVPLSPTTIWVSPVFRSHSSETV